LGVGDHESGTGRHSDVVSLNGSLAQFLTIHFVAGWLRRNFGTTSRRADAPYGFFFELVVEPRDNIPKFALFCPGFRGIRREIWRPLSLAGVNFGQMR
jgi:hypothetical protein